MEKNTWNIKMCQIFMSILAKILVKTNKFEIFSRQSVVYNVKLHENYTTEPIWYKILSTFHHFILKKPNEVDLMLNCCLEI